MGADFNLQKLGIYMKYVSMHHENHRELLEGHCLTKHKNNTGNDITVSPSELFHDSEIHKIIIVVYWEGNKCSIFLGSRLVIQMISIFPHKT